MKTCCSCKSVKPEASFNWRSIARGILQSQCRECAAAYKAEYRAANKPKINEYAAKYSQEKKADIAVKGANWYQQNKEKVLSRVKAYREENKERIAKVCAERRKRDPGPHKALKAARRAREKGASGRHTAADVRDLMQKQDGKCVVCKTGISKKYHVDHIQPLARGGSNDKFNIQLLCQRCNNQKHAKDPIEFMQLKGFLL